MNTSPDIPTGSLKPGDYVVNLNGVDQHYRVCGDGPLLFLISPGWGVGSNYLQKGFKFLQEKFRLVFVDTRGGGMSGRPVDDTKMSSIDMADDLEALRGHLGLSAVRLLGHSNAGAIALAYAQRYPERVIKLVLIDTQMLGFSAGSDTQAFLKARAEDSRYKAAVEAASSHFSGQAEPLTSDAELSALVAKLLPLYLHKPQKNLTLAREQLLADQIALYAFNSQNRADKAAGIDQAAFLDQVRAPTLIMSGRHDWICPVAVAERAHSGIYGSRLIVFESSGHMPWIEEPGKFGLELIRFLEDRVAKAEEARVDGRR